jgi:hypothetical protein
MARQVLSRARMTVENRRQRTTIAAAAGLSRGATPNPAPIPAAANVEDPLVALRLR